MAVRHRALPEDLKQLLDIIHRGQLFAVQDSLKAGKYPRVNEGPIIDVREYAKWLEDKV